jgi:hypothetical protein
VVGLLYFESVRNKKMGRFVKIIECVNCLLLYFCCGPFGGGHLSDVLHDNTKVF